MNTEQPPSTLRAGMTSGKVLCFALIACALGNLSHRLWQTLSPTEHLEPTLPALARITQGVEATERNGTQVNLNTLRGKVFTCAYLYTVCPHGCSAVVNQMKRLQKNFGSRPDFHQVSIVIDQERNTQKVLQSYAGGIGVYPTDPWWFLTGDSKKLSAFMEMQIGLEPAKPIPPEERLNPLDLNKYDLRIALIDRKGRVRARYDVFHPLAEVGQKMREQLQADTEFLLNNPNR